MLVIVECTLHYPSHLFLEEHQRFTPFVGFFSFGLPFETRTVRTTDLYIVAVCVETEPLNRHESLDLCPALTPNDSSAQIGSGVWGSSEARFRKVLRGLRKGSARGPGTHPRRVPRISTFARQGRASDGKGR